jgi:phage repressor protein C with HTH and peptisase S24 domain
MEQEDFKARMKRLRLDAGFKTQADAAAAIGCERGTVGMWEAQSSPVTTVSSDLIFKVAEVYKTTPEDINSSPQKSRTKSRKQSSSASTDADSTGSGSGISTIGSPKGKDLLAIPLLDSVASMGSGVHLTDHVNVLDQVSANLPELRKRVSFSAPNNLRLLTGYGDSMTPTFADGDILLIDVGVTDIRVDAVYVLQRESELFCKRLQRLSSGGFRMISDNPLYSPEDIDIQRDRFVVLARVICVWNMRKL